MILRLYILFSVTRIYLQFAVCHLAERFGLQGLGPLEVRRSNSLTISLRPKYYGISTDSADEVSKISTPDAVSNC